MLACILLEILDQPAEQSRGRHNPRVVKRKMSNFTTSERAAPAPKGKLLYQEHIRVVAPPPMPSPQPPPSPPPLPLQEKKTPAKPKAADEQSFWWDHVRQWKAGRLSRRQYCLDNKLDLRTFNAWAARMRERFCRSRAKSVKCPM